MNDITYQSIGATILSILFVYLYYNVGYQKYKLNSLKSKLQKSKNSTHPNCLEYALRFWEDHFDFKIYYNSDHVITLPKSYVKLDNYLPIEEYGLDHMLNSFTLDERSVYLLHKYFNYSRVIKK